MASGYPKLIEAVDNEITGTTYVDNKHGNHEQEFPCVTSFVYAMLVTICIKQDSTKQFLKLNSPMGKLEGALFSLVFKSLADLQDLKGVMFY